MFSGRSRRQREIDRLLRPDQGGEIMSEFALEFVFPLAFGTILGILLILTIIL
jgi:hypothetical protein